MFRSKAQMQYMFINMPKLAKEFMSKTQDVNGLPERLTKKKPQAGKRKTKEIANRMLKKL